MQRASIYVTVLRLTRQGLSLPCARPPSSERKAVISASTCSSTMPRYSSVSPARILLQHYLARSRLILFSSSCSSCSPGAAKRMSRDSLGREFGIIFIIIIFQTVSKSQTKTKFKKIKKKEISDYAI